MLIWTLLSLSVLQGRVAFASSTAIAPDEEMVFFASPGDLSADKTKWVVPIRGRIYEPETDSPVRMGIGALIRKKFGVEKYSPEDAVLQQRLRYFLADNEGGKSISVKVGTKSYRLGKSDGDGIFEGQLELSRQEAAEFAPGGVLSFSHETQDKAPRSFKGRAILTQPRGLSVISDIDDTVKVTNVRDQKEMLANTFLRPFQAVPGMAKLYRGIAESRLDARFHFVSGSPWQLYEPIEKLLRDSEFPEASFHLKDVSFDGTSITNLFMDPAEFKIPTISKLFDRYPGRKFILVGDSGEKDPEVYSEIFRKYPGRVEGIFIRNVTKEDASSARYAKLFAGIDKDKWRVFDDPKELESSVSVMLAKSEKSECATCASQDRRPANPVKPIMEIMETISK